MQRNWQDLTIKVLENWKMVAVVELFLGIQPTAAIGVLSRYGNQNKGQQIIQGKNFIQCTGGGNITIAPSI